MLNEKTHSELFRSGISGHPRCKLSRHPTPRKHVQDRSNNLELKFESGQICRCPRIQWRKYWDELKKDTMNN